MYFYVYGSLQPGSNKQALHGCRTVRAVRVSGQVRLTYTFLIKVNLTNEILLFVLKVVLYITNYANKNNA